MRLSSITTAAPVLVPVRVAPTIPGTLASDFANSDQVDDVVLATGDRVLIKNQATPSENGVYVVTAGAPVLANDVVEAWQPEQGVMIFVREGTVNARKGFMLLDNEPWTVAEHLHSTSGLVRALTSFYTNSGNSGTSETDAFNYALPANTIRSVGELLQFDYSGIATSSGSQTRRLKVMFAGASVIDTTAVVPAATSDWRITGYIICSAYGTGSTCSVRCVVTLTWTYPSTGDEFVVGTNVTDVGSVNLHSALNVLKLTLTSSGASNDLIAKAGIITCIAAY